MGQCWDHLAGCAVHGRFCAKFRRIAARTQRALTWGSLALVFGSIVLSAKPDAANAREAKFRKAQRINVEKTFNRQPALINKALAGVAPSPPMHAQMYFVGVAPYASQDVFSRELGAVKALFDERFQTRGRSVRLVNHRNTVTSIPLASATNLDLVLTGVGERMDRNKDILVLFITTHGTKGVLAVDFPRFRLNNMTPEHLADMLDRAQIKNRVLIISACHSGSFVQRLAGPNTLIMTAAHAEKTSFGCSNEREWTYFGDALFNHALRKTRSLTEAFGQARRLVGEWEAEDGFIPSDPQMSVGADIKRKLDEFVRHLVKRSARAGAGPAGDQVKTD